MPANKRYAALDLGTNTFHILIVERGDKGFFKEIYRERRFVKLAENGIDTIGEKPFLRGIQTIVDYCQKAIHHHLLQDLLTIGRLQKSVGIADNYLSLWQELLKRLLFFPQNQAYTTPVVAFVYALT